MLTKLELDRKDNGIAELKEFKAVQVFCKKHKRDHKFDGSVNRRGLSRLLCDVFAKKENNNKECVSVALAETDAERIDAIAETVVNVTGIDLDVIRQRSRDLEKVDARRLIIFFARWVTKYSLKYIGSYVSSGIRKDHATILYNTKMVVDKLTVNEEHFCKMFVEVQRRLAKNYDISIDLENPSTFPDWYKRLLEKDKKLVEKALEITT